MIPLSEEALEAYRKIADANGFGYPTGLIKNLLEILAKEIHPSRYNEAIVAAKQAGRLPEPTSKKSA